MVIDSSVLLEIFFNGDNGLWASKILEEHQSELRMSTVNLSETLIRIRDLQPQLYSSLRNRILESPIRLVAPTPAQAEIAAEARIRFSIDLGNCYAYGLAMDEGCSLMTLDKTFLKTDALLVSPF